MYPITHEGYEYLPDTKGYPTPPAPIFCDKCHAECKPTSSISPGYATLFDTDNNPCHLCYDCAGKIELETMLKSGYFTGYLNNEKRTVTNWTGKLSFPCHIRKGCHNWYMCDRYDAWFSVPNDPYLWHGVQITGGYTDIIRCKRTKTLA